MTTGLMPRATPPTLVKGAMVLRGTAFGTVDCGNSSADRWVIVVAAAFSGGGIAAFNAPTVNGVAMTEIIQQYSTYGDDGQRGAIWITNAQSGNNIAIASGGGGAVDQVAIFTMTGVRNPVSNYVVSQTSTLTNTVGSCVVGYFITNFSGVSNVNNMTRIPATTATPVIGYSLAMPSSTTDFTVTNTNPLVFQTKVSWSFVY